MTQSQNGRLKAPSIRSRAAGSVAGEDVASQPRYNPVTTLSAVVRNTVSPFHEIMRHARLAFSLSR